MKNVTRRCLAMMMALVMCASVVFGMDWSVQAATVDYVYSSPDNYILNWGVRGTNATFLSQNAEKFYGDNNTSYLELASLSGSNTVSSVPSSELYKELQDLMEDNHTKITSYNDKRPLYQYTDCQNFTIFFCLFRRNWHFNTKNLFTNAKIYDIMSLVML